MGGGVPPDLSWGYHTIPFLGGTLPCDLSHDTFDVT